MPIARSVRITRTAISPRLATSTVSNTISALLGAFARKSSWVPSSRSHPEDAVAELAQRRVGARRQGQPQHGAGLRGVDHAVVPQAGGGVVGVALVLVLLPDRHLERLLVLGRPFLAARLEPVAPDLGEHAGRLLTAHDRDAGVGPGEEEPG